MVGCAVLILVHVLVVGEWAVDDRGSAELLGASLKSGNCGETHAMGVESQSSRKIAHRLLLRVEGSWR